jgi:hypothetical protein
MVLAVVEVVGEVTLAETIAATKHGFKVVRPRAQHRTVHSDLFIRVQYEDHIIEVVKVATFYHITKDLLILTGDFVLW